MCFDIDLATVKTHLQYHLIVITVTYFTTTMIMY